MRLDNLFDRLELQENALAGKTLLAPVLAGRAVSVKVAGVTCWLRVASQERQHPRGWGVLEVENPQRARWMRAATRSEIDKYLALLSVVRMVALERDKAMWLTWPAQRGDARFRLEGAAVVQGAPSDSNVQAFETILARFDGTHFWFDRSDARRPPAIAAYLRESLAAEVEPHALRKKGLSAEERSAYEFALYGPPPPMEIESVEVGVAHGPTPDEANWTNYDWRANGIGTRLARSLGHGGGRLVSYIERGDVYTVTYRFGERTHTSTVRAGDLSVVTSGICLSGYDNRFDLTSLVGVMQEAARVQPYQFDYPYDYDPYDD